MPQNGPARPGQSVAKILIKLNQTPIGYVQVPLWPAETLISRARAKAETYFADELHRPEDRTAEEPSNGGVKSATPTRRAIEESVGAPPNRIAGGRHAAKQSSPRPPLSAASDPEDESATPSPQVGPDRDSDSVRPRPRAGPDRDSDSVRPRPRAGPDRDSDSAKLELATLALTASFALSLGCLAIGHLVGASGLRLVGVLGALFLGIGTAPTQLLPGTHVSTRLGVAGIVGLSTITVGGSMMVLVSGWHPARAGVVIGLLAVAAHCRGCIRAVRVLSQNRLDRSALESLLVRPNASVLCTIVGTALWCFGALSMGRVVPGVGGFLPKISLLWYAGLLLLLAAVVAAQRLNETYPMLAVLSLVSALTLTPALAYGMPRSQAAAKHIDLVQQILSVHYLDRAAGIYQAYSGLFSGVGWVSSLAHAPDPTGLATCWPFVIQLLILVELRFLFGRLFRPGYRVWIGITIVVLVNAIGADYFSPQSVGFVLALGVYALALGRKWVGLTEPVRIALLVFAGSALAVTHELSPFIVGSALTVLVIFRVVREPYLPLLILVPTLAWALLNWPVVHGFIYFSSLGQLSNFAPPKTVATPGLSRLPIVGESSHALLAGLLILIVVAGIGFVRNVHRRPAWAFMLCAGMGLVLIVANPYGNEGIFRAALFGIPWLAIVALTVLRDRPPRWMTVQFGIGSVVLLGTFLIAMFGLDNAGVMRPADMQAMAIYARVAAPNSDYLDLSYGDLPTNLLFPPHGYEFSFAQVVTPADTLRDGPEPSAASRLATNYIRAADTVSSAPRNELYAFLSPASVAYAVDYGLETQAQADRWRHLLIASPEWHVIFHKDGTYLFMVKVPGL
jgi:hypothetical protein